MLKSSTGTDRSDHMTTWTSTAVAEALLTENRVVSPVGLFRSTSKYGSSSVAAGTASMVQIVATAWPPRASRPMRARLSAVFFMTDNLLGLVLLMQVQPSKCPTSDFSTLLGKGHHLLFKV